MKDEERAEEARRVGGVATATEGVAGRRGWQRGRRVREREGEKERGRRKGRKKKKRRFRAAAGIAWLSVVKARSLCSILCASDAARLLRRRRRRPRGKRRRRGRVRRCGGVAHSLSREPDFATLPRHEKLHARRLILPVAPFARSGNKNVARENSSSPLSLFLFIYLSLCFPTLSSSEIAELFSLATLSHLCNAALFLSSVKLNGYPSVFCILLFFPFLSL